jgi:hypothetical protein
MVDAEAVLFLRRRSYPLPQGWWRMPAGVAGGSGPMISGVFRGC